MSSSHRQNPSFDPYFVQKFFNGKAPSPFPVSVSGLGEDQDSFFGSGQVIGSVDTNFSANPVIEIEDPLDGQLYTILGKECSWKHPPPAEIIEGAADGSIAISSIRHYLEKIRDQKQSSKAIDGACNTKNVNEPTA